jgi:hypothetical protein
MTGVCTAAADRIDALEKQLAHAVDELATGQCLCGSCHCPEGAIKCPDPLGIERRRLHDEGTDADLDACRLCWRTHLEAQR